MFLDFAEIFLLGAFTIIFLYFITHFFIKRGEKYNLYFAIGCLISIIRIITSNLYSIVIPEFTYYNLLVKVDYLSFIWGPLFYILLADSLFPKISKKGIIRIFIAICAALSAFILIVPTSQYPKQFLYDYAIIACILYGTYIFTVALIKKLKFAVPLFTVSAIFIIGVVHDVLIGSYIIKSPFGELHAYTYFIYLYVTSIVLARKYRIMDEKYIKTQLSFLHAQIKPHFLYNTISTIRAYCRTDAEKSSELLDDLSTYLRGKFKIADEMFTPLKEEIELIKAYLTIEQARYEERLEVEYDIDEECDVLIPCLVIQPIVENAVKHGLSPKIEGGKISIAVKKEEATIIVTIKDNGIGMDAGRMSDILDGKESGIGLSNTNERLRRYYGTEINVTSTANAGTAFTITIPLSGGNKNDKLYNS